MDIFDAVQSPQIHHAHAAAERASDKAGRVEQRISELEARLNRLALVTHSLWEMLKDRHGYTEEDLRDWVNLTDLKDGKLDGRVRQNTPPLNCHKCNRVVTRAFGRCMYCGEFAAHGDAFDRVH
jgi:hypothetical protein